MIGLILAAVLQTPSPCDDCRLRLALASDKSAYEVGEPITVSVELTNIGRAGIMVEHTSDVTGRIDGYRLDVFDDAGDRVPDPGEAAVSLLKSLVGYESINPGAHDHRQFLLNYHVRPLKPGRYLVRCRFGSSLVGRGSATESNALSITVVPTPPERMTRRIADLVAGMGTDSARAATLLGFTGNAAAIPAVIEALYSRSDHVAVSAMDALLYFDASTVQQAHPGCAQAPRS